MKLFWLAKEKWFQDRSDMNRECFTVGRKANSGPYKFRIQAPESQKKRPIMTVFPTKPDDQKVFILKPQ